MGTGEKVICVTASAYKWLNGLGGSTWPKGEEAKALVATSHALNMIDYMLAARDNTAFRVESLDPRAIVVTFENDVTHMLPGFPVPDGGWAHESGWHYLFAMNAHPEINPLQRVYEKLRDMCMEDARLCSPEVVEQLTRCAND